MLEAGCGRTRNIYSGIHLDILEAIAVESCRMYVQRCFYCAIWQTLLTDQKIHVKKTPPGAVPLDPAGDFSSTVPRPQ